MAWKKLAVLLTGLLIGISLPVGFVDCSTSSNLVNAQADSVGYSGTIGKDCSWNLSADGKTLTIDGGGGGTLPEGNLSVTNGGVIRQEILQKIGQPNQMPLQNLENFKLTGKLKTGSSAEYLFAGFGDSQDINLTGLENLNTENSVKMTDMFSGSKFKSLNLKNFNTSRVTDMMQMFSDTSLKDLDLSNFDTSNVTNMQEMFLRTSLTNLDVSGLDTRKVTSMLGMFSYGDFKNIKFGGKFNTSNVQTMSGMFENDRQLVNLDLSSLNTKSATEMNRMFYNDSGLTTLNLSSFDTSKVTHFQSMFTAASSLKEIDVSSFRTPNATDFTSMFAGCTQLQKLDLSKFSTENVVSWHKNDSGAMHGMFGYDTNLTSLDISNFKMTNNPEKEVYTYTDEMFTEDNKLSRLVLGSEVQFLLVDNDFVNLPGAGLPNLIADKIHTGKWQAVGSGSEADPKGKIYATSDDLIDAYMGEKRPSGKQVYVWQPVNRPVTPPVTPTLPPKPTPVPDEPDEPDEVFTGSSLNAIKKIGFYRQPTFTKKNRITWFAKAPRTRQSQFVVIGKATSRHGVARYQVRDVNRQSPTYKKTGYITTRTAYVEPTYVAKTTRAKTITVINPRGINGYGKVNLTQKHKHYRQGQQLKVKRIVTHNLTTRFQLTNGQYVTANRQWIQTGKRQYPRRITTKHTIWRYRDVNFRKQTHHYRKHQRLQVRGWDYSDHGTLRYRVAGGYVTANARWVQAVKS